MIFFTNDVEYGNFQSSSHFLKIFGISIFYLFQDDNVYIYIVIYIYIMIIIVDWPARMGKMRYTSYYIYTYIHIYIYMVDMDIMLVCMVILTNTDGFDGRGWPESGTPFQSCLKGHFAGFPLYLWLGKHMIFCRFSWKPLHESAVSPDFDVCFASLRGAKVQWPLWPLVKLVNEFVWAVAANPLWLTGIVVHFGG